MPALSIVMPTHNRAGIVGRAIESALQPGLEVVVVDDGSTDGTAGAVRAFEGRPVTYHRLPASRGPGYARNVGVGLAQGPLVLFLDDDDVLLPAAAETILSTVSAHPDHDLYLFACTYPDGRPSIPPASPHAATYADWLRGRLDAELKPVTRRSLFDRYAYEDTGAGGEGILWGRVIRERPALVCATPVIAYDTTGEDRLSNSAGLLERAERNADVVERYLAEFGDDLRHHSPARYAERLQAAAVYHLMTGRRRRAHEIRRALRAGGAGRSARLALGLLALLPPVLVRLAFVARRRELRDAVRSPRLRRAVLAQPASSA